MGEKVPAHFPERQLRDTGHDPVGDNLEYIAQHVHRQHEEGGPQEAGRIFSTDERVDGDPHEVRSAQSQDRVEKHNSDHAAECQPVRLEIENQAGHCPPRIAGLFDFPGAAGSGLHGGTDVPSGTHGVSCRSTTHGNRPPAANRRSPCRLDWFPAAANAFPLPRCALRPGR